MNTERSEKKAREFLASGPKFARKIVTHRRQFSSPPEKVFQQLCPTRELDWIDGWDCDLLYTTTGYVEPDCIFSTQETNSIGPGLWIFTDYKPDERVQIVRIINNSIVESFSITLKDNGDGTCEGTWHMIFTGINEKGSEMVTAMPEEFPELGAATAGLEHFLNTGELLRHTGGHHHHA